MDGVIEGAEIFVWLAYSATWGGLVLYGLSLWARYGAVEREYDIFEQKLSGDAREMPVPAPSSTLTIKEAESKK